MARAPQVIGEQPQAEEKTTPEQKRAARQRIPFGIPRSKLSVSVDVPGYHLHWVNDEGGRVFAAEQGGYEFVTPQEVGREGSDTRVRVHVGTTESGDGLFAYLMKIRQEWYEEDQAEIQKNLDQVEYAIKNGTFENDPSQNRYVKKDLMKFSSKVER